MRFTFIHIILIFCVLSGINVNAQIQENKTLTSKEEQITVLDSLFVNPFTDYEIERFFQSSTVGELLAGKTISINIDFLKQGTWSTSINGDKICRLLIHCKNAKGLNVYFNNFKLSKDSYLHLYSPNYTQIIGAFTSKNNSTNDLFSSQIINNDELILEYFEPKNSSEKSSIYISELGIIFKQKSGFKTMSGNCEVNINCPEGDSLQSIKRGVARVLIKKGSDLYWCSGSLINNTQQNRIPYFLTAEHCITGSSESDISQYQFYFNYESDSCLGTIAKGMLPGGSLETISGAKKLAESPVTGGSDFALLLLNNDVPLTYKPYFNGWDITEDIVLKGTNIHHPEGDIKKTSLFTSPLSTVTISGALTNAHWQTEWSASQSGNGVTEAGSSGSPLFNEKGYIVGTLSGGLSTCTDLTAKDAFGKISYHWNKVGTNSTNRLLDWLDPTFTGLTSLHGLDSVILETPDTLKHPFDLHVFNSPILNQVLKFSITNSTTTEYAVQLCSLSGAIVINEIKTISFNENIEIPLNKIPSGIYFLRVFNHSVHKSLPVIVINQ